MVKKLHINENTNNNEMTSKLYKDIINAGIPADEIDNHMSDLYVKKTPKSTAVISKYTNPDKVETFKDNIDNADWYNIPFAYTPFWNKVANKSSKVKIDMWYGDSIDDVTRIDYGFNDVTGDYRGNLYINSKTVGDFIAKSSTDLEKAFPQFEFNWD